MKKTILAVLATIAFATTTLACPQWECQLPLDDYSCGGLHSGCTSTRTNGQPVYDETTVYDQYIYCPYCGHEMWDCICGTYQETYQESCGEYLESYSGGSEVAYNSGECDYSGDYCDYTEDSYSCGSSCSMSHWANVRDAYGNIIGQIGTGSSVEVCGVDPSNPDRVLIYDYNTGTYGSVLSECVYGGYSWDGIGDNGYYNQYQGDDDSCYQQSDCQYDYQDAGYTDCGYTEACSYPSFAPSTNAVVRYTEVYQVVRQWEMTTRACNSTCWR